MEGLTVRLHWLTGSFPAPECAAVFRTCEAAFGGAGEPGPGRVGYKSAVQFGQVPVFLRYSRDGDLWERPEACLELSGKALDRLSSNELVTLLLALEGIGFSCTRLDAAADDLTKRIGISEVRDRYAKTGHFGPL